MESLLSQVLRINGQKAFRKRLGVYSYRLGHSQAHKRPGMIDLHTKEQLKKQGIQGKYKIHKLERDSDRQLGEFSSHSKFIFDKKKVPFLDVPDLTEFELKPYASVHTPRIELEDIIKIYELNNFKNPANFGRYSQLEVPATATSAQTPANESQ